MLFQCIDITQRFGIETDRAYRAKIYNDKRKLLIKNFGGFGMFGGALYAAFWINPDHLESRLSQGVNLFFSSQFQSPDMDFVKQWFEAGAKVAVDTVKRMRMFCFSFVCVLCVPCNMSVLYTIYCQNDVGHHL